LRPGRLCFRPGRAAFSSFASVKQYDKDCFTVQTKGDEVKRCVPCCGTTPPFRPKGLFLPPVCCCCCCCVVPVKLSAGTPWPGMRGTTVSLLRADANVRRSPGRNVMPIIQGWATGVHDPVADESRHRILHRPDEKAYGGGELTRFRFAVARLCFSLFSFRLVFYSPKYIFYAPANTHGTMSPGIPSGGTQIKRLCRKSARPRETPVSEEIFHFAMQEHRTTRVCVCQDTPNPTVMTTMPTLHTSLPAGCRASAETTATTGQRAGADGGHAAATGGQGKPRAAKGPTVDTQLRGRWQNHSTKI